MPLIDLKTNLKSLKYGQDRPGGGDSGQPYQQVDINKVDSGFNRFRMTKFDDGLVRGGIVGAANASIVDTLRIGKFLTDLPKGPLWIVKQVGLQLSNPKLESTAPKTGIGFLDKLSTTLNDKIGIGPTRIYNLGINTLAQVPVNALGIHFNRHGILPVQDDSTKYLSVVQNNNQSTGTNSARIAPNSTNRLLKYTAKLLPAKPPVSKPLGVLDQILSLIPGGSLFVKPQQQMIDEYVGGPGSVYGIGKTFIKRYDYTSNGVNKQQPQDKGKVNYPSLLGVSKLYFASGLGVFAGLFPDRDATIKNGIDLSNPTKVPVQLNQTAVNYTNPSIKKYANLRKQVDSQSTGSIFRFNDVKSTVTGLSLFKDDYNGVINSYTDKAISYNNGIDKPIVIKGSWKTMNRETRIGSGRQDEINLTPLFYSPSKPGNAVTIQGKEYKTRDLIKFRIGAIDTDSPANTTWMVFRAYLTGFQDSFNAEWSDIKYIGRGEKFKLYNGFDRSVTFNFKVAALSAKEMEPMYQKLNYLASNMMPDYKDNVMRGPFMKLTVGDYLNAQPGVFTSLQYSVTDDTPWEISIDQPEGGSTLYDLPHIINVTATFIPIGVKDGGIPERGEATPVMLQSDMSVNNAESNPWLKQKVAGKYTNDPLVAKSVDTTK
jgi:hypothetical protein